MRPDGHAAWASDDQRAPGLLEALTSWVG
ncbi:hypothetical protein [Nocardia alni]